MAQVRAAAVRKQIIRLVGNRVDIAAGVILSLLWQAKASAAGADNALAGAAFDRFGPALPGEAALIAAVDHDPNPSISIDELRLLLTPEELGRLGIDPDLFGELLSADPRAAIHKLDASFKAKIKLAAATAPAKVVVIADGTGGHTGAARAIASDDGGSDGGGNGILYALGGLLGAGGVAGLAMSGGGKAAAAVVPTVPTNAAPVAAADTATTIEDTAIIFDVRTNDSDANGDSLAITAINGTAITMTTPVATTGGSISLGSDGRLTFTPSANFNGPVSFTYTISDGKGGNATATTTLTVTAVNDAPVNTGPAGAVAATQATTVAISGLAIADVDAGTSVLTTTLAVGQGVLFGAVVTGGASLAGSGSATLILTGTVGQINASLAAITYRGTTGFAGTDTLSVTTNDGTSSDVDSFAITVTAVQTGVISDGYIAGGTVFIDVNGNGVFDPGEPTAQTDGAGNFSIATNATGSIIAFGGINADTGLPNIITMRAPAGSTVVNPLTTIVEQLVEQGATLAAANASVAAAFGLPAGIDFGSFDILAATDPALGLAAQKVASIVATLLTLAYEAADAGSSSTAEALVLARIVALTDQGPIDLGDIAVLGALFTGVPGIDAGAVAGLTAASFASLASIAAATSLDALTAAVLANAGPTPNQAPVTVADFVVTGIGSAVTFAVTANDSDPDGDPLVITAVSGTPISIGQPVAVDGGSVTLNIDGSLTFTPAPAFVGSPQFTYTVSDGQGGVANGEIAISVAATGTSVAVAAADITAFADNAGSIAGAGVATLDVIGDTGSLSDSQASALVGAGIEFAESDQITVEAQGTHLSTSLKGLQDLHVDAIAVGVGITAIAVDAGAAGLSGLSATGLPSFAALQIDTALDVTLNLAAGSIDPALDLGALAPALAAAGIDHIGVTGSSLSLTVTQAAALGAAGLDFAVDADVTMAIRPSELADVVAHAGERAAAGIDHLDVIGNAVTLSDTDAGALVGAGIDFADTDQVGVAAEGTHLATTLKGLQDLNVDSVAFAGIGPVSIAAGAGGFGGIAAAGVPNFTSLAGDPEITLTQAGGTLDAGVDLALLAPALAAAGIDHLGTTGPNGLSITLDQAGALTGSGIDFAPSSDITVRFADNDAATAAANAGDLAAINVDHLQVIDGAISISDSEAGQFVAAGLDFAESDAVSVAAEGTHLATTLKGLQDLNVDSVSVQPGVQTLFVAAGDLAAIAANGLPQFDIGAAAALDVTLAVAATDISELPRLAEALRAAGVDHIAIDAPLDSLGSDITGLLADITTATGIDFVEQAAAAPSDLYRALMTDLESGEAAGQTVELNDSVVASLVQAGMLGAYLADTVTIDATSAGDKPLTSLKSVADLNVDAVHLADQNESPVYIDLGIDATAVGELQSLFDALDPGTGYSRIFTGSDHVALVVDAQTADLLAGVDGALGHLAQLGFTEIDVLAGSGASLLTGDGAIEVKLIGQDDDLYDYLHHGRG